MTRRGFTAAAWVLGVGVASVVPTGVHAATGRAPTGPGSAAASTEVAGAPAIASVDSARVVVVVVHLDDAEPDATGRAGARMREVIASRLAAYDAELGEGGPAEVMLRMSISETDEGLQGVLGRLRLTRGARRLEIDLECSPCGGTEFVAMLVETLDAQALRFTRVRPSPPPVAATPATPAADVGADASGPTRRERWIRNPSDLGWAGLFLTISAGTLAVAGTGLLVWSATHRREDSVAMALGVTSASLAGASLVAGVPMIAVDASRFRKRQRTAAFAPFGPRRSAGVTVRVRF